LIVLCLNCGSSSLKFAVLDADQGRVVRRLADGEVERIGASASLGLQVEGEERSTKSVDASDIDSALRAAIQVLEEHELLRDIQAVGHRVVHGGPRLREPTWINDDTLRAIEEATELAPLHNRPALAGIASARAHLPHLPMVAVFDTAFHAGLPLRASTYALPSDLTDKYGIRRYGFHGLAHRSMLESFRALSPDLRRGRVVSLQLGSGCSATASLGGQPVDTSMGFTPLEGLIMGTRSGDIDPAVPLYLMEKENLSPQQIEAVLNKESGLLGLSGISDMRDLEEAAAASDERAKLALEVFCYRITKHIGAYMAALHGIDAVLFGGGIGERSPDVRARVCDELGWADVALDPVKNSSPIADHAQVSATGAKVEVWVMKVDEEGVMAKDVAHCLAPA
jgi:acetate kinase